MDISIIIPVYNVENYIMDCLISVVNQSIDGSLECILVDDCGSDNSWKIVETFIENYDGNVVFKLVRHEKNKGLSGARNTGIRNAVGDYVYFLDSDDTITEDCLESLSQPLREFSYDFVFANHNYICDYDISIPLSIPEGPIKDARLIRKYYRDGWFVLAWNKLINRQFLINNKLYFEEGLIHEDELWSFKVACVANSMYVVNAKTYNYLYNNPQSITSDKDSLRHFHAYTEVLKKEIEYLRESKHSNDLYLYYQIEEAKRWRMKDAVRLLSSKDALSYYKQIRNMHFVNPLFMPFDIKYSIRNFIRDLHYLLPARFGYKYMVLLNLLS